MVSTHTSSGSVLTTPASNSGSVFTNNPILAAYVFSHNEKIPQKVTSELNFIITKITRILDKKAAANGIKKIKYYKMIDAYILARAQKTQNEKDKMIFEYLHARFGIVSK